MALNDPAKNLMLDALAAAIDFVSLHTDVLGSGNTSEVTGGSPAYARKSITWGAAASGSVAASNAPVFDIPAGTTVRRVGFQTLASGGTFYGDAELTDEVYAGQGTYTLNSATISVT